MGITGYSYGGFLTNWAIGHTNIFRAAITGAGPTNWISNYGTGDIPRTKETEFLGPPWEATGNATMIKYSPITYAANIQTPTLFIHGEADLRVPIAQAEELYTALQKRKVPTRFVRYPGEYHGGWSPWNTVHRYQQEMNWWKQYLQ
jgi:dipeptidyl aminopeptidase/acylaminoacyl peptidase